MKKIKLTVFPSIFFGCLYLILFFVFYKDIKQEIPGIDLNYAYGILTSLFVASIFWLIINNNKYYYDNQAITVKKGKSYTKTVIPFSEIIEVIEKKNIFGYGHITIINKGRKIKLKNIANVNNIASELRALAK
jgi:hypothetical protein